MVEEVSLEQETGPLPAPGEKDEQEEEAPEQQGFISKYTAKVAQKAKGEDPEQPPVAVQIEEKQPEAKGMLARFEEKLKTDEEDGKKATEVVQAFQHALDYKNRSVVERASEKFMQDVEDDQDLDMALSS